MKKLIEPPVGPVGERQDQGTLLPLIKKFVRTGSLMVSNQSGAYYKLKDHGYTHHMINHSEYFVDPANS